MISKINFNNLYYRDNLNGLDGVWSITKFEITKNDNYFTSENSYMVLTAIGDLDLVKKYIDKVPSDNKYLVKGAYPSIQNRQTDILDYVVSKGFEIDLDDFYNFMSSQIYNKRTIDEYVRYIEFCINYLHSKGIDLNSAERPENEITYYTNCFYKFGWMVFLVEKKKYNLVEKICDMGFKLSVVISPSFLNEKIFSIIEKKEGNLDYVDGEGYAMRCYNSYKQQSFILNKFTNITVDMDLLLKLFSMENDDGYNYPSISIVDLYKKKGCKIDTKILAEKRKNDFKFILDLTLKYNLEEKYINDIFTFNNVIYAVGFENNGYLNKNKIKKLLDMNKISKEKVYDVFSKIHKINNYDVEDILELSISY